MKLPEATELVERTLGRYGLEGQGRLELVKYRENYVFKLTCPTAAFAVRVHRLGYRNAAQIRTEMAYLHALAERGLPVPRVVPTREGELLCAASWQGETVYVDVLDWVEGAMPLGDIAQGLDGASALTPEEFESLGVRLGQLHGALMELGRLPGFERPAWDAAGLVGPAPVWGDPRRVPGLSPADEATLSRALAVLVEDLDALPRGSEHFGVIHADLTPENVLISESRMTLIDFDDFGEGWHLFDLATVLFFYVPHPRYEQYRAALFDGYAQARPLPPGFADGWEALLLARALTYLGWAGQRAGDPEADFIANAVAPGVVAMARDYLKHRAVR
ncbi:phosphotransferase enzyme family protein [Zhihengliuella flava]|uniref:Ser/Thr protein kinase RdoA (MazF antagonist) n=1 Tax=Zhihengliuella flava TaxID=1285193 RepID=A0A931GF80_9MICC|nr:phosphotransferase [Zhihengliuella flava]MBG6085128.1 Ser/Thr protein kinase RdoA (MazF antagonist) [Zhihengliuella flava]